MIRDNEQMKTPIVDYIGNYCEKGNSRFHMPGHKGIDHTGHEAHDITEITGADSLYEASGIIAHSEEEATKLFGSFKTLYSTEGSSQCIKAMLKLVLDNYEGKNRPYILAARNVHKSFIYGVGLLDMDVKFIEGNDSSLCSSVITSDSLKEALNMLSDKPAAVYVTSPDYLGMMSDIKSLSRVCHEAGIPLIVDNAHGAYLRFIKESLHPMDLGADMCCDSAHKTLPVLTGGAYLHINDSYSKAGASSKEAMSLFGSTSPSYLILESLDKCNEYLAEGYEDKLRETIDRIDKIKNKYEYMILKGTDPLKITIKMSVDSKGRDSVDYLHDSRIEVEYSDNDYVVLMATPDNTEEDYIRLEKALDNIKNKCILKPIIKDHEASKIKLGLMEDNMAMSIREAIMKPHEMISVNEAKGRICASPTVSCPPAIPIAISGQIIGDKEIDLFNKYGIDMVQVVK